MSNKRQITPESPPPTPTARDPLQAKNLPVAHWSHKREKRLPTPQSGLIQKGLSTNRTHIHTRIIASCMLCAPHPHQLLLLVTLWVAEGTIRPLAPRPVSAFRPAPAPAGAGPPPTPPCSHCRRRHCCFRGGLRWSCTVSPYPHRAAVCPRPYLRRACPRLQIKSNQEVGGASSSKQAGVRGGVGGGAKVRKRCRKKERLLGGTTQRPALPGLSQRKHLRVDERPQVHPKKRPT